MKAANTEVRRKKAHLSVWGTTQVHLRNPYIIAWWSAAFPGYGHVLLSKYVRGLLLFLWEIIINVKSKLNLGMVYTFTGRIDLAKDVLDTRWLLLYIPVYLFAIWDSYRTCVDMNKLYLLADHENARTSNFKIGALEVNYLDKRKPWVAVVWSMLMPGTGQLYIHRVIAAFFSLIWWIVINYFSRFPEALPLIFIGEFQRATALLNPEWLLLMPSVYGFAIYDAYINTVENNKLFNNEQAHFLKDSYQPPRFRMPL